MSKIETYEKWGIEVRGGGQIADTGGYSDPIYMLTNGDIELITKDEIDGVYQKMLVSNLNAIGAKWEDWKLSNKEFELHLANQENKRLQRELHTRIYEEVDDLQERLGKQGQELVKWIGKAEEWKDMCKQMYYLMTDIIHLESEKPSNAK